MHRILDQFTNDFNSIYIHMTGRQRREIARLAPTLFVRWYYSALFQETILSPSAIIESQRENQVYGKGLYSLCLNVKNFSGDTLDFSFSRNYYSVEDHPIYNDLAVLYRYMSPVLYLNEDLSLKEKDICILQKNLSISDRYYVEYLFRLGGNLGMYSKMASIFEPCVQPDPEFERFFLLEPEQRFSLIIDISREICASVLNSEFPYDFCVISSDTINGFLEKPRSIDDMFISIYHSIGIDLDDILKRSNDGDVDSMDSAVISSAYYLGILMDKYFIYIFGHYLRLIRPLYSCPVSISETVNALFTTIAMDGDRKPDLFMPCTTYIHTQLGKVLFVHDSDKPSKHPPIPIEKIYASLVAEKLAAQACIDTDEPETIYTFRVFLDRDKHLWKKVELEGSTPLKMVYLHLMLMFSLRAKVKYSVRFIDKNKCLNFNEIGLLANGMAALSDISFEDGRSLLFSIDGGRSLELKFLESHRAVKEIIYPRIVSQSREITESERQPLSNDYI